MIIIDEWDAVFREYKDDKKAQTEYIDLLRGLFKDAPSKKFLKLAYMTGILPIKKYGTESALNNFDEFTMLQPDVLAEYEFINAVEGADWKPLTEAIHASDQLLEAAWQGDEKAVADGVAAVHMANTSLLNYNDENSLSCIIALAFYNAVKDYTLIREMPSGKGFADIIFLPKRHSDKPAMIVELKWNKSANDIGDKKTRDGF